MNQTRALLYLSLDDADLLKLRAYVKEMTGEEHQNATITRPVAMLKIPNKLEHVQAYIESLTYNFAPKCFFNINKSTSYSTLMKYGQAMATLALPIRCLEATIVAMYLTCGLECTRFSLSFTSESEGNTYRHIVLGIYHNGKFGAFGLSRKNCLMGKEFVFKSIQDLVSEYQHSYKLVGHELQYVTFSEPLTHEMFSMSRVEWNRLKIKPGESNGKLKEFERLIRR